MKQKQMIIMVGNIGSGKSTFVKKYQKKGYVVIAKDQIRYAIGGGEYIFNPDYENTVIQVELEMLDRFLELGVNVICDGVNISKRLRREYINQAKDYGYRVKVIALPRLSRKESVNRRLKNNHGNTTRETWEMVWEKFDDLYEKPIIYEGIDEIITIEEELCRI